MPPTICLPLKIIQGKNAPNLQMAISYFSEFCSKVNPCPAKPGYALPLQTV